MTNETGKGGDVVFIYGYTGEPKVTPTYDHVFGTIADGEVLRFTKEGEIRVHNEVIATDEEFVTEFFRFARWSFVNSRQREPDPGTKCTFSPGHGYKGAPDGRIRFAAREGFDYLRLENGRILSRDEPIGPSEIMDVLRGWIRDPARMAKQATEATG